jgi:hypothetical protein
MTSLPRPAKPMMALPLVRVNDGVFVVLNAASRQRALAGPAIFFRRTRHETRFPASPQRCGRGPPRRYRPGGISLALTTPQTASPPDLHASAFQF